MLEAGTKAPAFTLPDKDGNLVSLSDFAEKKVVLYFYPRDNTPGCTRQALLPEHTKSSRRSTRWSSASARILYPPTRS